MFRPIASSHRRPHRRGTSFVLIVVVMLSVFAVVGTGYALLAIREQKLSLARKDEQNGGITAPDPTDTVNAFLGTLIYDTGDSGNSLLNGLRGHSIGRSMYGFDSLNPTNTTPWNGVGLFHEDATTGAYAGYGLIGDRSQLVNYTLMTVNGQPLLLDPERMGTRGPLTATNTLQPVGTNNPNYVSKAAGYSYPDLKDFFAGAVDPNTGAVLTQSFHRDWLFGSLDPLNGQPVATYDPTKSNWFSNTGRLKTLRPRPAEHPNFPRVPPNADGTYTGDVQNWPGGFTYAQDPASPAGAPVFRFYARNDSLWMNLGLPLITLPGNRKVQPLVAPLIVPMDGLLNASAHGNVYNSNTTHVSYAGYGAWEVNLATALTNAGEAAAVVNTRGVNYFQRNTVTTTRAYAPSSAAPLPSYAPVAWNGAQVPYPAYPSGNSLTGLPNFGALGPTGFQNANASEGSHPSLFNPTEWPGTPGLAFRTFPLTDIKRLQRYGYTPNWYAQADVVSSPSPTVTSLTGNPNNFFFATGQTTPANYSYRLDPAHPIRGLFTTRAFDLDRPKLAPNFPSRDGALALTLTQPLPQAPGSPPVAIKPNQISTSTYPSPQTLGATTDFAGQTRWANAMAALGSVNLNRPLADYRDLTQPPNFDPATKTSTPQPLSAGNLLNATQADADRRQLAYDIFARLVVAVGAAAYVDTDATGRVRITLPVPVTFVLTTPSGATVQYTQQQYDALRYLAQIAVNIVDYIDNDDISTVFVWNPSTGSKPTDPLNAADFATPTEIGNRVVFGVEKPRLVLNEMYSEIVNDPGDPVDGLGTPPANPTGKAQVRFWAELLNPTTTLTPTNGPTGDGSVPLNAYQIQIRRETRKTGLVAPATPDTNAIGSNQYPYLFTNFANPTGSFDTSLAQPDATISLSGQAVTTVGPNNGVYAPPPASLPTNGIVLVGPPATPKTGGEEFAPAGGVWANMITSPNLQPATTSSGMGYTFDLPGQNSTFTDSEFKRHIVLLRRLANPYQTTPSQTNPYITVDAMDYVPSFDAVHRGKADGLNRKDTTANPTKGYDPVASRFSVGKVQPYAGHALAIVKDGTSNYNDYTVNVKFPNTMVLNQKVAPAAPNTAKAPLSTFGQHNGTANGGNAPANTFTPGPPGTLTDTIMTPFDWLVHLDRPLVNQLELLQVRDTAPYRVTDQFIAASVTAPGVTYENGIANWTSTNNGMARALELLSVKPFTAGVPHGGRVAGKIAINAVQDRRVLTGVFDPQSGNGFGGPYMDSMWANWMATRSTGSGGVTTRTLPNGTTVFPNGTNVDVVSAPGQSVYDTNATGANQPFQSLGAPAATPNGTFAYGAGGTEELTILRRGTAPGVSPLLYVNATTKAPAYTVTNSLQNGPSYMQAEPVRKIFNNTTTVSHTYLVYLTVGYFDVDTQNPVNLGAGVTIPRLGAEAYLAVPGDMRAKFVAVVDMSNMALDAVNNVPAAVQPFFTSLESTVYAATPASGSATLNIAYSSFNGTQLFVAADGQEIEIKPGSNLIIGYGSEQQTVTVNSVGPAAGQVNVTAVNNGVFRTAWGGTCVSNVRPGYSGPQAGFAYTSPTYKAVLPYVERLR